MSTLDYWRLFRARIVAFFSRRARLEALPAPLVVDVEPGISRAEASSSIFAPVVADVAREPSAAPVVEAPIAKPARARRAPRSPRASTEPPIDTVWRFREDILDRLDEYFVCMRRLRRASPEDYALFARVGLTIPYAYANPEYDDEARIMVGKDRPAYGGVLIPAGTTDNGERTIVSFVYFKKYAHPIGVQLPAGAAGDVYELTMAFDHRGDKAEHWRARGVRAIASCYVVVAADGAITLLRQRQIVSHRVQPGARRHGGRRPEALELTREQWAAPAWVCSLAAERDKSASRYAAGLFKLAFETNHDTTSRLVIRATRGADVATFGIDFDRAKTLFADRDVDALAADGKRKRIFHFVAEHERELPNGKSTTVREHFRGSRRFAWQGSDVVIVLPSLARLGFEAGAYEYESADDVPSDMVTLGDAAKILAEVQSR